MTNVGTRVDGRACRISVAHYSETMRGQSTAAPAGNRGLTDTPIEEVMAAMDAGVPVEAICLYPIVDHLGWDNDRACDNGLLSRVPSIDGRVVHWPLSRALHDIALDRIIRSNAL